MKLGFFEQNYLCDEQLRNLNHYKYHAVGNGPISTYLYPPFWDWLTERHPRWLAPNVLSLVGFHFTILPFLIVLYYDYDLCAGSSSSSGAIPSWVWIICAVCTFWGQTYDALDGKQARRTSSAGPAGEFFDHGLDCSKLVPFAITFFAPFGHGDFSITPFRLLLVIIGLQNAIMLSHWEKYITNILYIPWVYDSQYGVIILYIMAYVKGDPLLKSYAFGGLTICTMLEAVFHASCIISIVFTLYHTYQLHTSGRILKTHNLSSSLQPLVPFFALYVVAMLWAKFSPGKVLERDLPAFLLAVGIVFANINCQLIICQMSGSRAKTWNSFLVEYCGIAMLSLTNMLQAAEELLLLRLLALLLIISHFDYVFGVMYEMCTKLGTEPFSLQYMEKNKSRKQAQI